MRVAIVGPVYPFKGGIAQHTAFTAAEFEARGHEVRLENWNRQYPQRLYPGQLTIDKPEVELPARTSRDLSWNRPDSWWRVGRRLRSADLVLIAHVNPIQVPAYRVLLAGLAGGRATSAIISHNVLPHERRAIDVLATKLLFNAADRVVTHTEVQADLARSLTSTEVVVAPLPPFLPSGFTAAHPEPGEHRRLLFFGLVRPYKGVDLLLRALAAGPPDVRLRIAGEFWNGTDSTDALIRELGLTDRVEVLPGYAPADEVPKLFRDVDALVAPYREATGSQVGQIGFQFGVPVIASTTGMLAADIEPGVNGLTVTPGDVGSLTAAITEFYTPGTPERLRGNVAVTDPAPQWDRYLDAYLGAVR